MGKCLPGPTRTLQGVFLRERKAGRSFLGSAALANKQKQEQLSRSITKLRNCEKIGSFHLKEVLPILTKNM